MASLDDGISEQFAVMASSLDDITDETPLLAMSEGQDAVVTTGIGHKNTTRGKMVRSSEMWQLVPRLLHGRRK
jgi:hypothetical protein